ncbi:endochitinase 1 precursor [Histoplasma capsulatum G186AR]|uniref:Endochitinase 1 n=1 Tax=Ajellomyces capsulatus TaxID=5037 RepID=A0A8H7Z564_AJECA|nr:endochitinase 1 precursor [Histoplasma capsulatum]QSS71624.1 endochitinase 1 precursor [Histoplasma capsulatum G186AR]
MQSSGQDRENVQALRCHGCCTLLFIPVAHLPFRLYSQHRSCRNPCDSYRTLASSHPCSSFGWCQEEANPDAGFLVQSFKGFYVGKTMAHLHFFAYSCIQNYVLTPDLLCTI